MGFSFLGKAVLEHDLPKVEWTPLLSNFGYAFGFLIVILGRQQLYTENTLTVILPFLMKKKLSILANIGRLWTVVLLANLAHAVTSAQAGTIRARHVGTRTCHHVPRPRPDPDHHEYSACYKPSGRLSEQPRHDRDNPQNGKHADRRTEADQ
jgi:hypothetical protein